jgi:hypothetical protein
VGRASALGQRFGKRRRRGGGGEEERKFIKHKTRREGTRWRVFKA